MNRDFATDSPPRHPTLTLTQSLRHPGRLVFPEYPDISIKLPTTAVNVLVTLFIAWSRSNREPAKRGWLGSKDMHAAYQEVAGQKLTADAVRKNVRRLMEKIEAAFEDLGVEPPLLVERDDRGTHLARRLIIEDLTGRWKGPDEVQPEAWSSGQQFNVQSPPESTRQQAQG